MIPLIDIPEIVKHYSPKFESVFTASDFSKFQKYISGLIVSENKTVEAINRLFVLDVKDQSTLNRFLTDSTYETSSLNDRRLAMMNEQEATKFKDGGVLGLDDTFLIHYGKSFDQIALLHDHSTKQYVWAHNLVNLHYSDDQIDYPAYFELWQPLEVEALEKVLRELKAIKPKKEILKKSNPKKWSNIYYICRKKSNTKIIQRYNKCTDQS